MKHEVVIRTLGQSRLSANGHPSPRLCLPCLDGGWPRLLSCQLAECLLRLPKLRAKRVPPSSGEICYGPFGAAVAKTNHATTAASLRAGRANRARMRRGDRLVSPHRAVISGVGRNRRSQCRRPGDTRSTRRDWTERERRDTAFARARHQDAIARTPGENCRDQWVMPRGAVQTVSRAARQATTTNGSAWRGRHAHMLGTACAEFQRRNGDGKLHANLQRRRHAGDRGGARRGYASMGNLVRQTGRGSSRCRQPIRAGEKHRRRRTSRRRPGRHTGHRLHHSQGRLAGCGSRPWQRIARFCAKAPRSPCTRYSRRCSRPSGRVDVRKTCETSRGTGPSRIGWARGVPTLSVHRHLTPAPNARRLLLRRRRRLAFPPNR